MRATLGVAQTISGSIVDPPTASSLFCQCAKNHIGSTKTAAAPRDAAASNTAAAPAPAEANAATAAPAASAATAAANATSTATATSATATATSAATTATATAASTAAATARYLGEAAGAVFLVEQVECSQTDVGYFLFAKNEALIGRGVQRLGNVRSRNSGC
jgi:uncharacterized protein involved in copper resistance